MRLVFAPGQEKGTARFKYADCLCDVTDDAGNTIGTVGGTMGGCYEIQIKEPDGGYTYWLYPQDIWEHVNALHKQRIQQMEGQLNVDS